MSYHINAYTEFQQINSNITFLQSVFSCLFVVVVIVYACEYSIRPED